MRALAGCKDVGDFLVMTGWWNIQSPTSLRLYHQIRLQKWHRKWSHVTIGYYIDVASGTNFILFKITKVKWKNTHYRKVRAEFHYARLFQSFISNGFYIDDFLLFVPFRLNKTHFNLDLCFGGNQIVTVPLFQNQNLAFIRSGFKL